MGQLEIAGPTGDGMRAMFDASAAKRVGTPEDIANATEFVLDPRSSFITGTGLLVDGGLIAVLKSGKLALPSR